MLSRSGKRLLFLFPNSDLDQFDASTSTQNFVAFFRQNNNRILAIRLFQITLSYQVLKIIEPVIFGYIRSDAVGFQILMLIADRFRFGSSKKIDQIAQPETLARAINRAQRFLGDYRSVKVLECRVAVVAIEAVFSQFFGEIVEQKSPAAAFQITEFAHQIQLFKHDRRLFFVTLDLGKAFQFDDVTPTKKQQRVASQAVTTGAACFLV